MAHERFLACAPLKARRWVYERGGKKARPETVGLSSLRNTLSGPVRRRDLISVPDLADSHCVALPTKLAGSGFARGGYIVGVDPHESERPGATSYWGCLALGDAGLPASTAGWALWVTGRWLDLPTEQREATSRD